MTYFIRKDYTLLGIEYYIRNIHDFIGNDNYKFNLKKHLKNKHQKRDFIEQIEQLKYNDIEAYLFIHQQLLNQNIRII